MRHRVSRVLVIIAMMSFIVPQQSIAAVSLRSRASLQGSILLLTDKHGEAWYVAGDGKRYHLANPDVAYRVLSTKARGQFHISSAAQAWTLVKTKSRGAKARDIATIPVGTLPMVKFSSAQEFDAYVAKLVNQQQLQEKKNPHKSTGMFEEMAPMAAAPSTAQTASPQTESITNVQEQGVDEGDIVKVWKDYLIVLRRGRLFTIRLAQAGATQLMPVSKLSVVPVGLGSGGWYDEMLISGNRIIVVGYRYSLQATEIGLFRIDANGTLSHESTYFLDSNDYYSSRNYASRLVGNKLIFYMPYYLFGYGYWQGAQRPDVKLPGMRKWISGDKTTEDRSILSKVDIYKPIQEDLYPALHTVVTCDLSGELTCSAKAILGPSSRNFYVSPNAVYVWVSDFRPWYWTPEQMNIMMRQPQSYVYRFGLADDSAGVLRADGGPIDQFSFKEGSDGFLNVVVRASGSGEAMWHSNRTAGSLALLRVPIASFGSAPQLVDRGMYTALPESKGGNMQNRFVGDYLLYGASSSWHMYTDAMPPTRFAPLYIKRYTTNDATQSIPMTQGVDRIEAIGDQAVVIGASEPDLLLSSIMLSDRARIVDTVKMAHAAQGEWRSHGFFYKPQSDGTGIIGLPIRAEGGTYASLNQESSSVAFIRVTQDLKMNQLGSLASSATQRPDDQCEASCTDWYGNSRPIFYQGRIFALMGYELVEGALGSTSITDTQRVTYIQ